ncbi:Fc receptor 5 [Solea senegalensis]|uniref:Fc receptor 5 n=2 Tax=Solea senegalensis TaxID=28829 RepID=A0AAV6QXH5_SOLSE|nr:Fc receptor 5 [Solea senegalensis]
MSPAWGVWFCQTGSSELSVSLSISSQGHTMQLTPFCLTLACLRISPDTSQFYRYSSVSLSCVHHSNTSGWKVKRNTSEGGVTMCSSSWGATSSGSTCTIGNVYSLDSGTYWCESTDGQQSNGIHVNVTDGSVILESPALPVAMGATLILRCRAQGHPPNSLFHFYKDGRLISSGSSEMTIYNVSKSDEGLYKCRLSGGNESPSSWLNVDASHPSSTSQPSAASCPRSVLRLMCHLLVGIPYLLSTILLALIYRDRKRARTVPDRRSSNDVIMEIVA